MQNCFLFSEYGLPKKIMSDWGGNFISDKFKTFSRSLNIEQEFISSYCHQSNRQVEACIKCIKQTLKIFFDTQSDQHIALLKIRSTPLGPGLPSTVTLLFNCSIRGIMSPINIPLICINNDDEHYKELVKRQTKNDNNHDTSRNYALISIGSTVAVQWEDSGLWTYATIIWNGDHNHSDRSYTICITKTGWLITKHVKSTQITDEHYLWDQLDKHIVTDPLEDIVKQIEKQTPMNHTYMYKEQLKTLKMELMQVIHNKKAWQ